MKALLVRLGNVELQTLILLATQEPKTVTEIAHIIGDSVQNQWSRMRRLLRHGLVKRNDKKQYSITSLGFEQVVKRVFNGV